MAKRPYVKKGIVDLEELFEENRDNPSTLKQLHDELKFRKTQRARHLFEEVKVAIGGQSNTFQETTSTSSTPRADLDANSTSGSSHTSSSHNRSRPQSTTPDTEIRPEKPKYETSGSSIDNFIHALGVEAEAIKANSRDMTIALRNGKRIEQTADTHLYQFKCDEDVYFRDDSPVVVIVGENEASGTVVSVVDSKVKIALEQDFGDFIAFAQIRTNDAFLIERLKERYEHIRDEKAEHPFSMPMLNKVLGDEGFNAALRSSGLIDENQLNAEQRQALQTALGSELMFLWGPPGTGKTHVLATVIDALYKLEKRVLVVSNTNLAVDTLLEKLGDRLKAESDVGFNEGAVVRFGNIVKEELRDKYEDYVNVDAIVQRLSEKLIDEKEYVEHQILQCNSTLEPLKEVVSAFNAIEEIQKNWKKLDIEGKELATRDKKYKEQIDVIKADSSKLKEKLEEARSSGAVKRLFKGLNPEKIENKISENKRELDRVSKVAEGVVLSVEAITKKKDALKESAREYVVITHGQDKNKIKQQVEKLLTKVGELETKLSELLNQLNKIRDEVLKNCKVLAATATQVYLKPKDFLEFDSVIIDEASMLILPAVGFAAGMVKENVVVAGDFRQLPPIVMSDNSDVEYWLGQDIFEKAGVVDAVEQDKTPDYLVKLNTQFRMDKRICELINHLFYKGTLITHENAGGNRPNSEYPEILSSHLTIVDTSSQVPFANLKPGTFSRYNVLHAVAIRNLVSYLVSSGFIKDVQDLGVITPYSAQAKFINKMFIELGFENVAAGTVHRFQGSEKDVIFLDISDSFGVYNLSQFVRATDIRASGAKLLNVAASRSKSRLILFANVPYLLEKLPDQAFLRTIIGDMQDQGRVVDVKEVLELGPSHYYADLDGTATAFNYDTSKIDLFDESTFDAAFLNDAKLARKSIVIFSAFATPQGVGKWVDLFRQKIAEGVKVRVVTRPPSNQGSIDPELVREAIYPLKQLGVAVDLRTSMHEKHCIIDSQLWWTGSLNPLSHTGKTDESMIRIASESACEMVAEFESYTPGKSGKNTNFTDLLASKENPDCPSCQSLTVFHPKGRYGPYFDCERKCGWSANVNKAFRASSENANRRTDSGNANDEADEPTEEKICPECGKELNIRSGRFGKFWGCTGFPKCRHTEKLN